MAISHYRYQSDQVSDRAEGTPPTFRERVHGLQSFFSSKIPGIIIGLGAAAGGYLFHQGKEGVVGKKTDRPSFIAEQIDSLDEKREMLGTQTVEWNKLLADTSGSSGFSDDHYGQRTPQLMWDEATDRLLQQISSDLRELQAGNDRYRLQAMIGGLIPLAGNLRNRANALPEGDARTRFARMSVFCDGLAASLEMEPTVRDLIEIGKSQITTNLPQNGGDDLLSLLRDAAAKVRPSAEGKKADYIGFDSRLREVWERFQRPDTDLMAMDIQREFSHGNLLKSLQSGEDPEKVDRAVIIAVADELRRGMPPSENQIGLARRIETEYPDVVNPTRGTTAPAFDGVWTIQQLLETGARGLDRHVSAASPRTRGQ